MQKFTQKAIKAFCMALLAIIFSFDVHAQNLNATGQVTGKDDGLPVPGVSVTIKGTTQGVSTDVDGKFTISAPSGSKLVFTAVGYQTIEADAAGAPMKIVLPTSSNNLTEVTVVGVTIKKGDLTGSVGSVDEKVLKERPVTNVNQAIQGRVSGVLIQNNDPRPGGGSSIKIRGNNSIQFGSNPIYVVDGQVIEGGFNTINPDDVASVDILKDASATALYGSRGANGVVLITTKRAKKGEGKIDYNAWAGVQSFTRNIPYLNAQQIVDLRSDAYANRYIDENPGADRNAYIQSLLAPGGSAAFGAGELEVYRAGQSYNWLDQIRQTGIQQNHTMSFSKGSEDGSSAYVSFNYTDQKGLLKTSNYKRFGGQVNLDQKIKPWLKIGTNTNFTRTEERYIDGGVFNIASNANPLLPITDTIPYLSWKGIQSQDLYNPIRSLNIDGRGNQNRLLTTNYVVATPMPGLNIRSGFSVEARNQNYFNYVPRDLGQSLRNSTQGSATHRKENWMNWQWDNSVSYEKAYGKHNIQGALSFGLTKNDYDYNQVDAWGFATDDFSYKYLGGAFLKDRFVLGSDFVTNSLVSYVARFNYNYDNKYFATLTGRYDGSSRFGNGNKWGLFPSLALAYNIAREEFMQGSKLSTLKLRAGYGIAGNQNIPNFAYRSLYRPTFTNGSVTYVSDGRLGNPSLRWEKQKQLNVGVDLGILDNRITLNADYFIIHNDDLLMQRTLSATTGFTNRIDNVGSLLNKGLELNLNAQIINQKDLQWSFSANISSYRNRITKLYGNVDAIYNYGGFTGVEIQREGNLFLNKSLNSIYTYKFEKIAQESDMARTAQIDYGGRTIRPGDIIPVDVNGDNKIDDADRIVVGNTDPKFYGGFATDVSYKGFGLNAVFNYNVGGKRVNYLYESLLGGTGEYAAHEDELNRWTPTNTNTNIPRAYRGSGRYGAGETDYSVQSAAYLRLSALTVSYNFNGAFMKKAKMSNLRLYLTGSNLFTATGYKGYDPEGGDGYPTAKMIVAGVNVGF
ncbi:TonB-dependent receptor [Mucilaginibacter sp. JRF]|uniref:SusC/RagA family TonB-linked outer membrane protein n=1 Tax=Mucilaginibacter sp. JRF TaxID=2780088 RepID=UPI001881E6D0|nr:TonB-dependent receptor [Mucilaginibacter sp. JRF]MBE9583214.1 TonB-dependent receptor [Mucilaginibacter sp. JRF]